MTPEELDVIRRVTEWLRGDEAEQVRALAVLEDVPPEDALALAIERHWELETKR